MHRSPGITASALLALSLSACGGQAESITESVCHRNYYPHRHNHFYAQLSI